MRFQKWAKKLGVSALCLSVSFTSFAQEVKFNNQFTMACHNCYETKHATDFQDVFHYTKTIELDIWNSDFGIGLIASLLGKGLQQDWYVKHKPQQRGNNNFVGGTFRDCLLQMKAWSDSNPGHDVVTVFIDKKQNWCAPNKKQRPADLDYLLQSIFTKDQIFSPAALQQASPDLKSAACANWPVLDSLKGKFIFVLTDGTLLTRRQPLNEYLDERGTEALCFVSPRVHSEKEICLPSGFSEANARNVVFYNLKYANHQLSQRINGMECISRVYGSKHETESRFAQMVEQKVNFVAFYNYKLRATDAAKEQDLSLKRKKVRKPKKQLG